MGKLHEECGVYGIWNVPGRNVSTDIYYGLMALQHRGQESAGIAVCKTDGERGNLMIHKEMGLVSEVFNADRLNSLIGNIGIGHVRYSTTGESNLNNAQPLAFYYLKGTLGLVHNGNIVNTEELKKELFSDGYMFRGTTDSEVLTCLVAKMRAESGSIEEAVRKASKKLIGGYAVIIMSPRKLVAMRDPYGLKPLCLGKKDGAYVLASESCALASTGAEFVRDIEPGEIVTISKDGVRSEKTEVGKAAHCIFEYIYFARLDSTMDGIGIYGARLRGGRALAKAYPVDADIVAGVPDSGIAAAYGYSLESGIPFANVFHKNSYVGRTFIKPTQAERVSSVHIKLSAIPEAVKGKKIVLIDDSIVRGTTIANLIKTLRADGALEVHVRISSPPFLYPCYYGTDVPDNSQLIANQFTVDEICKQIGADSLGYMRIEDLKEMTGDLSVCTACFSGVYPTD